MLNKRSQRALLIILCTTLVLKLAVVLLVIPKVTEYLPYTIGGFVDRYDSIAENLLAGNGYRVYPDTSETLLRSPGYVLLLTGLFSLFGKSLAAAQIVNILCGLATAYVIVLITVKWVIPRTASIDNGSNIEWTLLLPAVLYLFYPGIILAETRGGVESLFTLLLTGFVFLLYRVIEFNRYKDFAAAGAALGLTMLVKSTPALIPVVFFPYLLLRAKPSGVTWSSVVAKFTVMGLAAFIVLAPWGLRNYELTGEFLLTSTVKGTTAQQGLYVNKHFGSGRNRDSLLREATAQESAIADELGMKHRHEFFPVFYTTRDEVNFDHYLFQRVVEEYMAAPGLLLKSCILNFAGFWFLGKSSGATYLNMVLVCPLLIIAGWGTYSGYRRRFNITPLILVTGAFIVPHLPILGVARYHVPLIPFLVILATIPFMNIREHNGDV